MTQIWSDDGKPLVGEREKLCRVKVYTDGRGDPCDENGKPLPLEALGHDYVLVPRGQGYATADEA